MNIIKLLSLIAFLPTLFPIYKVFKRKDINAWDLMLLFIGLYFCFIPFFSSEITSVVTDSNVIWKIFFLYSGIAILLLLIDLYCSYSPLKNKKLLMNITFSIRGLVPYLTNTKYIRILSCIVILGAIVIIIPNETVFFEKESKGYLESSIIMLYGRIYSFFFILNILLFFNTKKNISDNIILFLFFTVSFFLGRRYFFEYVMFFLITYYSLYIKTIRLRSIVKSVIIITLIITFLFPFYNVMRQSIYEYNFSDKNNIINSTTDLVKYSFKNYDKLIDEAKNSTNTRSYELYHSLYCYILKNPAPLEGSAFSAGVLTVIPSILGPNQKKISSESMLESHSNIFRDMADSLLLLCYGDWHMWGICACILILICFMLLVEILHLIFRKIFYNKAVTIVYIGVLFLSCISIEQSLEEGIAILFHSTLALFLLVFLALKKNVLRKY